MYIHKYVVNDQTIYLVSGKASKPSKNLILTGQDWKGYSSGSAVGNAVSFLSDLKFSKESPEPEKDEKKKKAVSQILRGYTKLLAVLDDADFLRTKE